MMFKRKWKNPEKGRTSFIGRASKIVIHVFWSLRCPVRYRYHTVQNFERLAITFTGKSIHVGM